MYLVGKSHRLFPTLLSMLVIATTVLAGQWQESVYSLSGFPQIHTISFGEVNSSVCFIAVSAGYDDIYRKKITSKTALTLAEQSNELRLRWPFRIDQTNQIVTAEVARNFSYFNNLDDQTNLVSRCQITNTFFSTSWALTFGVGHFGGSFESSRSSTPFTIDIISFPQSEDSRTNKYFFDLLEPTFGRELINTLSLEKSGFSLYASTRLNRRYRIGISMRYADFDSDCRINYINSGQKAALAGQRRIDFPINGVDKFYRFSLLSDQTFLKDLSITFFSDKFNYFIDNNRPDITDLKTLGQGDIGRSGSAINFITEKRNIEIFGGLSLATYDLDVSLNTPVIGFQWGIIPISHAATIDISRGSSFAQQIGLNHKFISKNFHSQVGLTYTHTLYNFWIEGGADLMLGLESVPLDYPFTYSLHLLDLHVEMEWRQGPFGLTYTFQQLIPTGRRLDASPIRFTKKTPGVEYTNHGGQRHHFNLGYYF